MAVCFILQVRVKDGHEEEFLRRYDALRERVAAGVDGHVVHQLCQGIDEPDRWLIASQWQSLEASQAWERSEEHRELTMPLRECWEEAQRAGYEVRLETRRREAVEGEQAED
jgi:heme-degrading monooxygenase HmoA